MTAHDYSNQFFDYIDDGARTSAQHFIRVLSPWIAPKSVLDLGSGRGAWLSEWMASGLSDVIGVDGAYVDQVNLVIPSEKFVASDLTKPVKLGRKFDLAQSLEVGEHLPNSASATLVESLTSHSDRVVFSAAVPGQGGEFHINERPLEFWRQLFRERGYDPYDCIRPILNDEATVEPWYRYNAILYLNETGRQDLSDDVITTRIPDDVSVPHRGDLRWRLRKLAVSTLPQSVVTAIAKKRGEIMAGRKARL